MASALLIENGTVLTLGGQPQVLLNHSVLIEDGLIARVAPQQRDSRFHGKRIDARGKVVLPGFINAHTHFYSTFARGLTNTKPARDFNGVLKNLWWRLDWALNTEDCYYSALIALLDSIRHGTTTIIDHHASPQAARGSLQAIERAVRESGLRVCLCYEVSDRNGAQIAEAGLEENVHFIQRCRSENNLHLRALFGLHASFTLLNRTLETAAELGHELNTGFHIHVAEAASDQEWTTKHCGKRVVERLHQFQILGPQSIAAHCIHVDAKEIELLAETNTAVAHNPQSNMNNAVGVANLSELAQRGVLVGLGTDAMTTNMLEELRVALWGQHLRAENPSAAFTEVTAALAANNPRIAKRIFGQTFGTISEGAAGDVVLINYDPPTPIDDSNSLGHLVFGISQAAVDTTIVGGRVLMEGKNLTLDLDEEKINARARELAKDLWKQLL